MLVTVAGSAAFSQRLTVILNSLIKTVSEDEIDNELRSAVNEVINALFSSINDLEGLNTVMMLHISWYALPSIHVVKSPNCARSKHESPRRRVSTCDLFTAFCEVFKIGPFPL